MYYLLLEISKRVYNVLKLDTIKKHCENDYQSIKGEDGKAIKIV